MFESNDRKKNIESYAFNDFFIKSASAIKNLVGNLPRPDNCDYTLASVLK